MLNSIFLLRQNDQSTAPAAPPHTSLQSSPIKKETKRKFSLFRNMPLMLY